MITLSIRQPWAWLIIRPDLATPEARAAAWSAGGLKDIENRDWLTQFRGRMLVHAGKGCTRAEWQACADFSLAVGGPQVPALDQLQRGGVIGAVDVIDCVEVHPSRWFVGQYGFVLRRPRPLNFTPYKGQLGFFDVPRSALIEAGVLAL